MGSKVPTPPPTDPEHRKPPAPAGPPSPMAPDTTRKAVNLAAADARRAIEALQEQSISLQRELAEARAALIGLAAAAGVVTPEKMKDFYLPSLRRDFLKQIEYLRCGGGSRGSAPGPSDAKGEWTIDNANNCIRGIGLGLGIDDPNAKPLGIGLAILRAIAKLKSTPAEPAQKLVKLPEGAVVGVPIASWSTDFEYIWYKKRRYLPKDPTLYGVPAERVRELEAENDKVAEAGIYFANAMQEARSEAERLRKAMSEAVIELSPSDDGIWPDSDDVNRTRVLLSAALTPPTAASGEETETELELLSKSEADIAAGRLISHDELKRELLGQPPSAPAAESGRKILNGRLPDGAAATCRSCGRLSQVFVDDKCPDCDEPAAPAAESEGVIGTRVVSESGLQELKSRLAACEERCKAMERVVHWARVEARDGTALGDAFKELDALLAPKAEGAEK